MEYRLIYKLQEFHAIRISFILLICLFSFSCCPIIFVAICYLSIYTSKCFNSVWAAAALQVEILIFSLCWCSLCPDFIQAAGLGRAEPLCWGFGTIQFLLSQKLLISYLTLWLGQLGSLWTEFCPASQEQRRLLAIEGTGKCQFWAGLWGFSWITAETALAALRWWRAGCATGWPRAGQSSASQMQFVVGGFSHPRKNRLLLVRPGCPPCFSSGHSLAACCWQPKPAFNSPALPKCAFYNYILLPSSVGSAIPQPPGLWNALLGADKERGWSNALLIF